MLMELWRYVFAVLVWPGVLGASALGFLYLSIARSSSPVARPKGPALYQPFFDFVKLLGKQTVVPRGVNAPLFYALPYLALLATAFGLVIVRPLETPSLRFPATLSYLLYLLEVPVLCDVLAGYASQST